MSAGRAFGELGSRIDDHRTGDTFSEGLISKEVEGRDLVYVACG